MISNPKVTLRLVGDADDDFLLTVYAGTRAAELAQVPWSAEQKDAFLHMQFVAQRQHYAAQYPQAKHEIILLDQTPVGRLYLDRPADGLHILDITIAPQYRNSGIGSFLLGRILEEARNAGKPLTIYVESFSPSLRLFERLGFRKDREEGFQLLMKWSPSS